MTILMIFPGVLLSSPASNAKPSKFLTLIQDVQNHPDSYPNADDFLAKVPPELLSNYVLMHHSESLQEARPLFPRAIAISDNGNEMLSFNGEPGERGFSAIEAFVFNDKTNSYSGVEIDFSKPSNKVQMNPQKCTNCHGSPLRPIWDLYQNWPDGYSENLVDFDGIGIDSKQNENYRSFLNSNLRQGRYKFLPPATSLQYPTGRRTEPFAAFTGNLMSANLEHLSRAVQENPTSAKFAHLLTLAIDDGDPEQLRKVFPSDTFSHFLRVREMVARKLNFQLYLSQKNLASRMFRNDANPEYEKLKLDSLDHFSKKEDVKVGEGTTSFVTIATAMGVPIENFMLNGAPHFASAEIGSFSSFDFIDAFSPRSPALKKLAQRIKDIEESSQDLVGQREQVSGLIKSKAGGVSRGAQMEIQANRRLLIERFDALAKQLEAGPFDEAYFGLQLIQRTCFRCHQGQHPFAPVLDFAHLSAETKTKLRAKLQSADPKFRMPVDRQLPHEEVSAILKYVEGAR